MKLNKIKKWLSVFMVAAIMVLTLSAASAQAASGSVAVATGSTTYGISTIKASSQIQLDSKGYVLSVGEPTVSLVGFNIGDVKVHSYSYLITPSGKAVSMRVNVEISGPITTTIKEVVVLYNCDF